MKIMKNHQQKGSIMSPGQGPIDQEANYTK